ncbi:MAG: hypothetical protein MMC33_000641 [Icmadophila ericetorum]|nr:hypothetical protein [Icmadophila ericetorum]
MPPIVAGQKFSSLQDFKKALRDWAIEKGFTPAILDSDTHRVRAGCRSSADCPFRIRANFQEKNGFARVTTVDDTHNCIAAAGQLASQDIKRAETCRLKFLTEVVPTLITVTQETSTKTIMEVVEKKYGQKIAIRQAQKVKAFLAPKSKGPCPHCGKAYHRSGRCPLIRKSASDRSESPQQMDQDYGNDASAMQLDSHEDEMPQPSSRSDQSYYPPENNPVMQSQIRGNTMQSTVQNAMQHAMQNQQSQSNQSNHINQTVNNSASATSRSGSLGDVNVGSGVQYSAQNGQQPSPVQMQMHIQNPVSLSNTTRVAATGRTLPTPQAPPPPAPQSTLQLNAQHNVQHAAQTNTQHTTQSVLQNTAQQTTKTPAETRMEAAKLMQQAARLMQEAAKLNAEAARLTASVANA